jgi:hypothetical protein
MATDTVTSELAVEMSPQVAAGAARPYEPSWIDRFVGWLEALPGSSWLAYAAIAAAATLLSMGEALIEGKSDPIVLATAAFWGVMLPFTLWLVHALADVAGSAFDSFRPALTATDEDAARIRYGLTVTPARPAWIILIGTALATPLYYIGDPAGSGVVGLSPIGLVLRYLSEVFFGALIFTLLVQSFRQLRAVSGIHASATHVDLFQPAPLYAFSILTSRTAMVLALVFVVPTLVAAGSNPATANALLIVLPWLVLGVVAAALVFVVPLRGMQRRILEEKRRLQTDVGGRIESTIATMHERIDADDPAGARAQHEVLQALVMERDLVDRLPTLPWRPGTLGALVSAVVAPLALFVVTRLLERLI